MLPGTQAILTDDFSGPAYLLKSARQNTAFLFPVMTPSRR